MTPIDPPPGLLDAIAEAMHNEYEIAAAESGWRTNPASRKPWADIPEANKAATLASARAAWGAVVEGLGLERFYALREDDGTIWLNDHDTGEPLDSPDREWVESIRGGEELVTRLVSKWDPQP